MNKKQPNFVTRNKNIDIIKGMLVISMLVYHCASVGRNVSPELSFVTSNMSFIHFSFLIISGYLCSWYYIPRLQNSSISPEWRIRKRSFKIFSIFIVSNLFLYVSSSIFNFNSLIDAVDSPVKFINNCLITMNGNLVAFEILYYIAVFLLLISFVLKISSFKLYIFLLIISCFASVHSGVILFCGCGIMGVLLGMLTRTDTVVKIFNSFKCLVWISPVILIFYLQNITFVKELQQNAPQLKILFFSFESVIYFSSFILFSKFWNDKIERFVILFGKYTLFSYLAQMIIIRFWFSIISNLGYTKFIYYFINLFVSTVTLYIIIFTLNYFLKKSIHISKIYKIIFC